MIRLPLCPNRRRVAQNLTNIPPLHAEILIQPFPNLALGARALQRLSVAFGLHFCERVRRPLCPGFGQRPVAEVDEGRFVEDGLGIPFSAWAEIGGVVCVSEFGGEEGVRALGEDEGGGAEVVVEEVHVVFLTVAVRGDVWIRAPFAESVEEEGELGATGFEQ